jgi:hypothetical protein
MPALSPDSFANISTIAGAVVVSLMALVMATGFADMILAYFARPSDD